MKNIISNLIRNLAKQPSNYNAVFTRNQSQYSIYQIGEFTYGTPSVLHWGEESTLEIGRFCSIADNVTILLGGNHRTDWISTYPFNVLNRNFPEAASINGHPSTNGNVVIGNDVWIGRGATILSGVSIESGAVIAAEAVVTKNVGPYEIVGGNPARLIRIRFSKEVIDKLLKIKWWDWKEEEINKAVHLLCSDKMEDFVNEFYK